MLDNKSRLLAVFPFRKHSCAGPVFICCSCAGNHSCGGARQTGGKARAVAADEGPWRKDPAKLASETGRFGGSNSVTAGNASPVSDGAAALVLMSGKKAAELNVPVCFQLSSK